MSTNIERAHKMADEAWARYYQTRDLNELSRELERAERVRNGLPIGAVPSRSLSGDFAAFGC